MKKIFYLFFLIGFLLSFDAAAALIRDSIESIQQESSGQIISYAKEYRKNTTLPWENEELRQKNILEQVFTCLTKYDSHRSLESAINGFLADEIIFNKYDYTVIDASLTEIGGKSHDPVFLVRDSSGNLCCIVKAFRSPRDLLSKFVPEISALDLIQQLQMSGVVPIKPIAFASYSNQDGEWGLLMETAAKGQRIDQFVYQLGNLVPDSKEREAFLEVCKLVFRRMAESLAELHARKSSQPFSIPERDLAKYVNKVFNILESPFIIEELEKRCSADDFFQYIEKIKANTSNVPVFYSYLHGDAHLGNMFYDLAEDAFYFIDVAKLHLSVSINEEPLLNGTKDLMSVEGNLLRRAIGVLSENEVEALLKSLYETYEKYSGQRLDQDILLFERTYKNLGRLVTYARYIDGEDPIKRSTDQAVFDNALEYFENQVRLELFGKYSF